MQRQHFQQIYRQASLKDFFEGSHFVEMRPSGGGQVEPVETVITNNNFIEAARQFKYLLDINNCYAPIGQSQVSDEWAQAEVEFKEMNELLKNYQNLNTNGDSNAEVKTEG